MTVKNIKKVAVIGSGVMGSAIAAHIANSNTPVILLDIIPEGAKRRNQLAEDAIARLIKTDPAPLTHKRKAKLITPGNLEDNLDDLKDVDWIIEAVIERIDIKQQVYKKIDAARKADSIVSSNTSTMPLKTLVEGLPKKFQNDFLITHFFNPPRYMRLLEVVEGEYTHKKNVDTIIEFADKKLGKGVVECNDTPGFIANRIGCFWVTCAVTEAMKQNITVEEADALLSRPIGVPKTGVFGLLDLIGLDLMPLIAKAFKSTLPPDDDFLTIYDEPQVVKDMIADGYTGRKGKGGFYRLQKTDDGKKVKEVKNLTNGEYAPAERPKLKSIEESNRNLKALLTHDDKTGHYAKSVIVQTLAYAAKLVPDVSEDVTAIDEAMRLGYNWKYGPFELIDRLSDDETSGAKWLADTLEAEGKPVPQILKDIGNQRFYKEEGKDKLFFIRDNFSPMTVTEDAWMLADKKRGNKPVKKNPSAALWDIGDGVLCLEFTSKMNAIDPQTLEMVEKSIEEVKKGFTGLVVANDADNFCVGANIGFLLFTANLAGWKMVEGVLKQGQDAYMGLKFAPFPVVTAISGMALGGGCEIALHSDAVQAHIEMYSGLVEVGVGIVPGWGGCKEMLLRHKNKRLHDDGVVAKMGRMFSAISLVRTANSMPIIMKSFEQIGLAKICKSADEARSMLLLREGDDITMNRKRLLPDAKSKVQQLAQDYAPPKPETIQLPGNTARKALYMGIRNFVKSGKATPHDEIVSKGLADVLSGGKTSIHNELTEQDLLDLEREAFMELVKTKGTLDRLEHMLEKGKPLRN